MTGCERLGGILARECHLLDLLHEFARAAFLDDSKLAVFDRDFEPAGRERAGEDDGAGVLRNVDEAAAAIEAAAELAGIDVAEAVAFGHAEAGQVETAAVVEIEHLVLVEDRVSVCR